MTRALAQDAVQPEADEQGNQRKDDDGSQGCFRFNAKEIRTNIMRITPIFKVRSVKAAAIAPQQRGC